MNKIETFQQFLATSSLNISIVDFVINLVLASLLAYVIGLVYTRFGNALSNRKSFARVFVLMTMITMVIITVVKSSLALSLGLVGALSIVRFRTAVKEPEELAYLFFCISIGLGLGAGQRIIVLVATVVVIAVVCISKYFSKADEYQNLHLAIYSENTDKVSLTQIVSVLETNCKTINLKRFDESDKAIDSSFILEFDSLKSLETIKLALQELDSKIRITFLDKSGIF
jgi:uncharacterized membrane protein YhiD involved in acid resistance